MSEPFCPSCELSITAPAEADESSASMEFDLACPGCGRPLTWFAEGEAGGGWIRDEDAEARSRMELGPDG